MTSYFIRRLSQTCLIIVVMSFVIYALIGLMPGDPIDIMVQSDPNLTPADAQRLKATYGLDQPIVIRYLNWLTSAIQGEFGFSRIHNRPVLEILAPRLANTSILMGSSLLLALIFAIPMGILSARYLHSRFDYATNLFALSGISIPVFWLALISIVLFSVYLGWLPASAMYDRDANFGEKAQHMVLPVVVLSIAMVGQLMRHTRAAMIEALAQDYIRTASAKGLSEQRIIVSHAFRNSMLPVVTVLSLNFGSLFSGALITETMFSYLGTGKLIFDSIMGNDYNMALVSLLFATGLVLLSNFIADLLYAWLDPRISYS